MDSDYFTQTQAGTSASQNGPSKSGVAGTIHKVQMKNFMCHDNLEVQLNPRINFVIGKNGSGKSAIQTAVAVGLGGSALATNRGSSIKDLIKHGKKSCTITITINNEGGTAYNPSVYGHFIKVERMFSESSSCYKIKDVHDKVVSHEKRELERICDHFNIQPENPLCILQQDMARSFLNSSDPKKKYTFFLKASRLGDISNIIEESTFKAEKIKDNIKRKFQVVEEAFHDVLEIKEKLKIFEDARENREKCAQLEKEVLWAEVYEHNLELKKLQRYLSKETQDLKNLEDELKYLQDDSTNDKMRELESKLKEIDKTVEDARTSVESARSKYMKEKDSYNELARKFQGAKENMKSMKHKYDSCMTEIEKLVKSAPEIQQRQESLKEELNMKEKELDALGAADATAEHDKTQLNDTIDASRRELQTCEQNLMNLKRKKAKVSDQLKELSKSSNDLIFYGEAIVKIVAEIERAARSNKFSKKPIGPIGRHIKVHDPKWAPAVENFMSKGFLSSFCVDNASDSATLAKIIKPICASYRIAPPPIVCSKFLSRAHNISANETGTRELVSLVGALDIDTPVVANCIIDQLEAESVLLIPTNAMAYDLLDEEHKVPAHCKKALTMTGDQFIPAPNYKSYSASSANLRATLLHAKQEDLINECSLKLNDLTQNINLAEKEKQKIQHHLGELSSSMRRSDQELRNIKKKMFDTEQRIMGIKNELQDSGGQTNVAFLEEESRELKSKYEAQHQKCEELKNECESVKEVYEESKSLYENLKSTIDESNRQKVPLQIEIQKLTSLMQETASKERSIKDQIKRSTNRIETMESKIKEIEEVLASTKENASQACGEEIKTRRSKEEVKTELKTVKRFLTSLENQLGGSEEELQNTLRERQASFDSVTNHLNEVRKFVKKQLDTLLMRKQRQLKLQKIMMSTAKHHFQMALKERNLEGKLQFDVPNKSLEIKISRPENEEQGGKNRDTFSLSGGEKSFATVCFIMALWLEIELPFHFMDEFDVFMDGINRKVVIDMLLDHANNSNQQFIFLTPLDASSIPTSDNITIHRLKPPRQ
ncbi:structural maintenance of chromosomes protein 6 [Macrosteles quadrilineatus]|uniref:structural maintenance of chromosomes protein 6 n=1 Tax=Macrosteles quadrilineatus TaxID=74068 RepID=UPI0023E2F264|nr:structural maintenance of chromosomes protein 6 [Macrosteles quadrilineatus]XP_054268826.1 structural maintenance of chromosomes protein 6 [Macrosteles quadrilineatus]